MLRDDKFEVDFPITQSENENKMIQEYNKYAYSFPILTEEEEKKLIKQYSEENNQEAGKKIILHHLKLIPPIVRKYARYQVSLWSLISEATLGMMHALKKFNPNKGARFSTYAELWIHESIRNFILKSWSVVQAGSVALRKKMLFSGKDKIEQDDKKFIELKNYKEISFEDLTEENENFIMNSVSESVISPEKDAMQQEMLHQNSQLIHKMLNSLNDRERLVVEKRILGEKKITLEELSKELSVSKERIRQIEAEAIQKMKKIATSSNNDYINL
jgi:RNA polymerase sigma-32 factor